MVHRKFFNILTAAILILSQFTFAAPSVDAQGAGIPTPQVSDGHNPTTQVGSPTNTNQLETQVETNEIAEDSFRVKGVSPVWEESTIKADFEQGTEKQIPETNSPTPQPEEDKSNSETPPIATAWGTIMTEGFEGTFPSGSWHVFDDDGATNGEFYWDDDDFKPFTGGWSAWAARGGANGLDPASYYYPNYTDSWMEYGPFDLSNANDAELLFRYWNQSEVNYDWFGWYASLDGVNYYGTRVSGDSAGWQSINFDLTNVPTLGNVTGHSSVWIALLFMSDSSNVDDGPFVDDVILQKNTVSSPNLTPYAPSGWDAPLVASSVTGTNVVNTLYANQNTYIDWAVTNTGSTTTSTFTSCLYYDNGSSPLNCWDTPGLSQNYYAYVLDWALNLTPTVGSHTLTIKTDVYNNVAESNENDNNYSRTFSWIGGACGPYTASVEAALIPDDGTWLTKAFIPPYGSSDATLTDVLLKLDVDHASPSDLEVEMIYNDISVNLSREVLENDAALSSPLRLTDFHGQPAAGQWTLRIRDGNPNGITGTLDSYSIHPMSTIGSAPALYDLSSISNSPTSMYLPFNNPQSGLPDPEKDAIVPDAIGTALGWNTIMEDGFEGAFPSGLWSLDDLSNDGCNFLWDDDDYRHSAGGWAGWPANGGTNGLDPATSKYPPNMNSWVKYGPFDLSDATDAQITFKKWLQTESGFDTLFFGVSSDGVNFSGFEYSGTQDWTTHTIGFQDFAGDSSVWIAFAFQSDGSINMEGAWIDEIKLEKYVGLIVGDCTNGYGTATEFSASQLIAAYQDAIRKSAGVSTNGLDPYTILLEADQFVPDPGYETTVSGSEGATPGTETRHFLIQFYASPSPEQKRTLAAQGIKLLHYIPNNTWIASANVMSLSATAQNPSIRWTGDVLPDYRESVYLRSEALRAFYQSPDGMLPLLVEFAADVSLADGKALIEQVGGTVESDILSINAVMVKIPAETYPTLRESNQIIWIEPPLPRLEALNDCVRQRMGVDAMQSSPYNLNGSGIDVLVYDAGTVSTAHPAFSGRLTVGDSSGTDEHATHVAGTVAGSGANSPFLRDLKGMAPFARVISYGFEGFESGWLYTNPGDIETDWSVAKNTHGADLGTASIGTNTAANGFDCGWEGNYGAVSQLIDDIVTGSLGEPYITTWAAGNERGNGRCGTSYGTTAPPSGAKNPIHVGATYSDSDVIASFSSFGPTDDGRIKPTISAPGCEQGGEAGVYSTVPDSSYDVMCGTSMATPAVAGLNALLIQQYRATFATSGEPLPSTVKALLIHTALDKGNAGPDYQYGYGRVDGVSATDLLIANGFHEDSISQTGEYHEYTYSFSGSIPSLKVSIAWDDEPATPSASVQLVNDLDLTLISPSSQTYYPFVLNPSSPGQAATTGADHLNNQEQVIVPNPQAGTWIIRVRGNNIPAGPQRYSIVFAGAGSAPITRHTSPGAFNKSTPANGATNQPANVTLTWGSSSGATSYEYCYDTTNDSTCSTWTNNGTSTSKSLSGLGLNTTYYWHVRSVNPAGTTYSNNSSTAFWSFSTGTAPGAFNKSSPANGATGQSTSPTLSWGSSTAATSYEYCYDTSNDSTCSSWTNNGSSTSIALSSLSQNTVYYWHVRSNNAFGTTYANGSSTTFWSFTTGGVPGSFNKSGPANGATNQPTSLTLSWGSSPNVASYEYCYDTSNDSTCSSWTNNGSSTSITLSGLGQNTTYYWHVRANNSFGTTYANGASTAFWSFTTGSVPGSFNKSSPANGATNQPTSLTLSWVSSPNVASYEYCYDTSNDSTCSNWTNNGSSTSIALSGLSQNTTYYWHVRANNAFGTTYANGSSTAFWSFTVGGLPGAFNKNSPANGATNQPTSLTMSWGSASNVTSYEYCYDTTNDNACSNWTSNGLSTSKSLSGLSQNTTYYWHVRAINPLGATYADGSASVFWSFTTGGVPGGFEKSEPANGAINQPTSLTLMWNSSSNATAYEYCYDTSNDNSCAGWTNNGTSTSKLLSGLSQNTTYYWHVRAINSFGSTYANGSSTAFWSFTTGGAPGAFNKNSPTNGATNQPTSLLLSWGSSAGVTYYEYCYDTTYDNSCNNWTSNGTSTTIQLNGLNPYTTYYWQVRAVNTFGTTYANGSSAAFWPFTTGGTPGAFNKNSPLNGATNQATSLILSWGSSTGASSYEYCYDTTNDNTCSSWTNNGTSTSKSLSGLDQNTTYYWHVRASNSFGSTDSNGAATAFWSFTTGSTPGAFNKLNPLDGVTGQPTSITLSWAASAGAASYEYCYDTSNDNACSNWTNNGTSTSRSLSGLSQNTTYYWQVRANNAFGTTHANGSSTAFWSFTTALNPPGAFNKISPINGALNQSTNLTLSWGPSIGATAYEYCYDTTNDGSCLNWQNNGTSTTVLPGGLSYNTKYYWHVRALNGSGTTYANGSDVAFWVLTTQSPAIPGVPALLSPATGAVVTTLQPVMDWNDSNPAAHHYQVQVATNSTFTVLVLDATDIPVSTFTPAAELTPGQLYYWRVKAFNVIGQASAWSAVRNFKTPLAMPMLVSPIHGEILTSDRATFDWDPVTGASQYTLQASASTTFSTLVVNVTISSTEYYTPKDLPQNKDLYWRVRAKTTAVTGPWSASRFLHTGNPASIPVLVAPVNSSLLKVYTPLLNWNNVTLPTGTSFKYYEIQVDDNSDFSSLVINATTTMGDRTDSDFTPAADLASNTRFYWRVRAVNVANSFDHFSAWSPVWSFRTVLAAPESLLVIPNVINPLQPTFDWANATGPGTVTNYTIQISTSPTFSTFIVNGTTTDSIYVMLKNLPAGKTIYWRVRVNGANGPSLWTTGSSFVP